MRYIFALSVALLVNSPAAAQTAQPSATQPTAAQAAAAKPAQPGKPALHILGVPLGGTVADIERMSRAQGFQGYSRENYCDSGRLCRHRVNIENVPGTDFIFTMWGQKKTADHSLAISFAFTAPPNAHRIWSAGTDQRFGDERNPGASAPMWADVQAELNQRFGKASYVRPLNGGTQALHMRWVWDTNGRLLNWTKPMFNNCGPAIARASVEPGIGVLANSNVAPLQPQAFLWARQGGCARAAEVEMYQTRGVVYYLKVRVMDFQMGHDSQYYTTRMLNEHRAKENRARTVNNKPNF